MIGGVLYPNISNAQMIWLKRERDSELFDVEYLAGVWRGRVPEPELPPPYYLIEYDMVNRKIYGR